MCAQNIGKANVVHPQNTYFPMLASISPISNRLNIARQINAIMQFVMIQFVDHGAMQLCNHMNMRYAKSDNVFLCTTPNARVQQYNNAGIMQGGNDASLQRMP